MEQQFELNAVRELYKSERKRLIELANDISQMDKEVIEYEKMKLYAKITSKAKNILEEDIHLKNILQK